MKKQTFLFILFVAVSHFYVVAQVDKYKDIIQPDGLKNKKYFFTVSGISDVELIKPINLNLGMSFNGGIRILYKPKFNKSKSVYSPRIIEREIFFKPTFGFIYRKRYNTSLFFIPELAYRHTFYKGIFLEINLDAGYLYTKMNAPVYEQQDDGSFKKVNFGYHNVLVGGKFLAGYDFSKTLKTPLSIQAGAGVFYRYPNNDKWVRHIYFELGISYVFRKIVE
ncbi:MAG: hypothetical protein R2739_05990 [Chitinophagales bacterium]|nr:hypothetical protein [Bacteroidota bacterium]